MYHNEWIYSCMHKEKYGKANQLYDSNSLA